VTFFLQEGNLFSIHLFSVVAAEEGIHITESTFTYTNFSKSTHSRIRDFTLLDTVSITGNLEIDDEVSRSGSRIIN